MKTRVLTAAALIPIVLLAVFLRSPWPVAALASITTLIGLIELSKLLGVRVWQLVPALLATLVIAIQYRSLLPVVFGVGVLTTFLCLSSKHKPWASLGCAFYVSAPLAALATIPIADAPGIWQTKPLILLALVPIWIGDTAAILVGSWIGKHPMAPKISPKKTWEGGIGNLIGCIAGAMLLARLFDISFEVGIAIGIIQGILGQAGDLFESHLKRVVGVKDSGTLLPGHGGVLDRIDSILFTAPFVVFLLAQQVF